MNRAYESKRKTKLEAQKIGNSPNKEKTNGSRPNNQKYEFALDKPRISVSFFLGLRARSKPKWFSVYCLKLSAF